MSTSMVSSSRSSSYNWERNNGETEEYLGPTFARMKEFIREAFKVQTYIANIENSSSKKSDRYDEINKIEEFVEITLNFSNYKECHVISMDSKEMAREMINLSKRYGNLDDIYYTSVWVYYFEYETEEIKSMPLFKVFKGKHTQMAGFIDLNHNVYNCWDEFLDTNRLPKSFICVPRSGSYVFDSSSKKLDLIYIRSKMSLNVQNYPNRQSFGQTIMTTIRSWFRTFGKKVLDCVHYCTNVIRSIWNDPKKFRVCLLMACCVVKDCASIFLNGVQPISVTLAIGFYSKMFFNTTLPSWDLLHRELMNSSVGIIFKAHDVVTYSWEKDWDQAFSSLTTIMRDHCTAFSELLNFLPMSSSVRQTIQVVWDTMGMLLIKDKDSEIVKTKLKIKEGKATQNMKIKGIEEFLDVMEEKSADEEAEKIVNDFSANDGYMYVPVSSDFPGSIYIFQKAYLSDVNEGLQVLFDDFRLRPRNSLVIDVTDARNNVLATLYYLDKKSAFLWVRQT